MNTHAGGGPTTRWVDVAVVGGGLAGGLLALELAEQGLEVVVVDGEETHEGQGSCATQWSYGAISPFAGHQWRRLQQHHGELGWRPRWFRPWGSGALLGGKLPLRCSRVDVNQFRKALPRVLERAGVEWWAAQVNRLETPARVTEPWLLPIKASNQTLAAWQVVLAAGAGSRALWPHLSERLRVSWAGVLELSAMEGSWPWGKRGSMRLPAHFQRLRLEAEASSLMEETWVVDPGLVPWGEQWLAGQITLVRPGWEAGEPPDAQRQERRLREALVPWLPQIASWPGTFQQVPVSFTTDGNPLVGRVAESPTGLWIMAGLSGSFTTAPRMSKELARAIKESSLHRHNSDALIPKKH
jgi:glycine/D-amino acid oxidase-like deaminating enzyme